MSDTGAPGRRTTAEPLLFLALRGLFPTIGFVDTHASTLQVGVSAQALARLYYCVQPVLLSVAFTTLPARERTDAAAYAYTNTTAVHAVYSLLHCLPSDVVSFAHKIDICFLSLSCVDCSMCFCAWHPQWHPQAHVLQITFFGRDPRPGSAIFFQSYNRYPAGNISPRRCERPPKLARCKLTCVLSDNARLDDNFKAGDIVVLIQQIMPPVVGDGFSSRGWRSLLH